MVQMVGQSCSVFVQFSNFVKDFIVLSIVFETHLKNGQIENFKYPNASNRDEKKRIEGLRRSGPVQPLLFIIANENQ